MQLRNYRQCSESIVGKWIGSIERRNLRCPRSARFVYGTILQWRSPLWIREKTSLDCDRVLTSRILQKLWITFGNFRNIWQNIKHFTSVTLIFTLSIFSRDVRAKFHQNRGFTPRCVSLLVFASAFLERFLCESAQKVDHFLEWKLRVAPPAARHRTVLFLRLCHLLRWRAGGLAAL